MRTVTLNLPSDVSEDETLPLQAVRLFEERHVSLGKAAELAGYRTAAFVEILGHDGVTTVAHPAEELADDARRA